MLYIFGGLPGTGKTTLARYLAEHLGAVYLRIDTIEQEMRNAGIEVTRDEGYRVAYRLAADNLRNGLSVIADSVNPIEETRAAWRNVAEEQHTQYKEIEIICSNSGEHQDRVESRITDLPGIKLPSWQDVLNREYDSWTNAMVQIDTAGKSIEESTRELLQMLGLWNKE